MSDFQILKSVNRGKDWTQVYAGEEESGAITQDASGRLWVVAYTTISDVSGLYYMYSTDLGETWTGRSEEGVAVDPVEPIYIDTGEITPTASIINMDYDVSGTIYLSFFDDEGDIYLLSTVNFFQDVVIEKIEVPE